MIESEQCILRNLFNPVLEAAESINTVDLVVVATPMWNYSVPYVLKQYIGAPRFQTGWVTVFSQVSSIPNYAEF